MLWKNGRESDNVSDQRSVGGKTLGVGGLVVGAVIYYFMGGNPLTYLAQNVGQVTTAPAQNAPKDAGQVDEQKKFVSVVLAETEDTWSKIFKQNHRVYREPKLVLFSGAVQSACGRASSAVGPFYCPGDTQVYLDLNFFKELSSHYGAKGDFAQAYVIAHEVGHHVQNLLGLEQKFRQEQSGLDAAGKNKISVKIELQADCFAGVWAKQTDDQQKIIEEGDVEEALTAAAAVGDDRLQEARQGQVVPDSFTHGSSAQRVAAFQSGFAKGDPQDCMSER